MSSQTLQLFLSKYEFIGTHPDLPNGAFGQVLECQQRGPRGVQLASSHQEQEQRRKYVVKCIDFNRHYHICQARGHDMSKCPDKELQREYDLLMLAQSCPYLCKCIEVLYVPHDHMYIVMPRYQGDLLKFIETHELALSDLKTLARRLLCGLAFLQEHHVIHRDIKPENVLLDGTVHTAVIADFGCGRRVTGSHPTVGMGTQQYQSPEMMTGQPYDLHTDMWSTGCLLYLAATRRLPFPSFEFALTRTIDLDEVGDAYGDRTFTQLLDALLSMHPHHRPLAADALMHPFVTSSSSS
ncbi:serine/threonine protein kinase [Salpingoeca rosetta]|uniref:Serine/threonine protein kinase n=1 Tax=Salpingoeca rosetta (strain ATCC 50818 / BSB-021) TaxID=946362 RepID=F2UQM9_SALR5|nr:serine/threonine protein kinase [Salpingoeca rosetta]EGD79934.1 serine/threonine protein kinase [Salpingoeca rosetta]|eukprot:XP_004988555.1 serine/threonine protein kinase [Salpingoeca rosetta]